MKLYVTPAVYLKDLTLTTDVQDKTGVLNFRSEIAVLQNSDVGETRNDNVTINYRIYDDDGVMKGGEDKNLFKQIFRSKSLRFYLR